MTPGDDDHDDDVAETTRQEAKSTPNDTWFKADSKDKGKDKGKSKGKDKDDAEDSSDRYQRKYTVRGMITSAVEPEDILNTYSCSSVATPY